MTDALISDAFTVGDIAKALSAPVPTVRYAIERARIEPIARIGITRLFNRDAVEAVRRELQTIRSRTAGATAA